eukprot:CAMPEP_0170633572 /NCGR_PEP_ID=MMETSP0224-20130122/36080_1 /TAXON_ID=285029 /ORGANISM="Togula jolla, Strain CCCM 725" /LENGTH=269 /DNA_ID=CAMNT_0010962655 /DNA_START=42 /DNA_END=848 /DNA_ORIENTATION=+
MSSRSPESLRETACGSLAAIAARLLDVLPCWAASKQARANEEMTRLKLEQTVQRMKSDLEALRRDFTQHCTSTKASLERSLAERKHLRAEVDTLRQQISELQVQAPSASSARASKARPRSKGRQEDLFDVGDEQSVAAPMAIGVEVFAEGSLTLPRSISSVGATSRSRGTGAESSASSTSLLLSHIGIESQSEAGELGSDVASFSLSRASGSAFDSSPPGMHFSADGPGRVSAAECDTVLATGLLGRPPMSTTAWGPRARAGGSRRLGQ